MIMKTVNWIQLEFFSGYPAGHFQMCFKPDGRIEYSCEGEDLPTSLPSSHKWVASKRVYQNLARILIERRWEEEVDPSGEDFQVCDGWTDVLSWSINGATYEIDVKIGVGPASIIKVIERMNKLLNDEGKKHPIRNLSLW